MPLKRPNQATLYVHGSYLCEFGFGYLSEDINNPLTLDISY